MVGAWLIVQVSATLLPVFDAPTWVMKALVGVLVIGFFVALVVAWVFELTPEGLKRDGDVAPAQSIARQTAQRLNRAITVVLLLAIGYFAFDKFMLAPQREAARVAAATKAVAAPPATTDGNSIAVLPFDDLSPEKNQAYFSDGIAEELLNALAQVQGLKVAGRASSSYYRTPTPISGSRMNRSCITPRRPWHSIRRWPRPGLRVPQR